MISGKNILVAPLDWGLGHATRCIPLIRDLERSNRVVMGITPLTGPVLRQRFPHLETVQLPAYDIRYSSFLPVWAKLLLDWRRISPVIGRERQLLAKLTGDMGIDTVVSDSRYGLYHEKVHSVMVTHQLFLRSPVFPRYAQSVNRRLLGRFDEIWVPDNESVEISLSGELSHGRQFHPEVKFIGPLSRFTTPGVPGEPVQRLFILSGPEPMRTVFENEILTLQQTGVNVIVRGTTGAKPLSSRYYRSIDFTGDDSLLASLVASASQVICRSGYSTLMDMSVLKPAQLALVPTPGQPEQAYLAEFWHRRFGLAVLRQGRLKSGM
jgi:hypothetical protein